MARVPCFILSLAILLFISVFFAWWWSGKPWFIPKTFAVQQLERVLPQLEQLQLEAYRNQSWCKNIAYSYGKFSESRHPTTCDLFDGIPQPFDDRATGDFQTLRQTFLFTGVRIRFVNLYYENETVEDKRVRLAAFHLECFWCSRTRYVYEPYYVLQQDMGFEMWFDAVNETWYEFNEDWN
jgi:hypothetical protein